MQKIYCRSIRPDGYGEGVVPEIKEPTRLVTGVVNKYYEYEIGQFRNHIDSLPVLYLIHPDLHKGKVGWVGEYKERYEQTKKP